MIVSNLLMTRTLQKIENGGWTPAIRQMAIEAIDSIMTYSTSKVISSPQNPSGINFQIIHDKLLKKRYISITEWRDEVYRLFAGARQLEIPFYNDICDELQSKFDKKMNKIDMLSKFMFRDFLILAVKQILPDLNPPEEPNQTETSEQNQSETNLIESADTEVDKADPEVNNEDPALDKSHPD